MVTKHIGEETMGGGSMHVSSLLSQPRSPPIVISSSSSSSSSPNLKLPDTTENNSVPFISYTATSDCENCRKLEVVDGKQGRRSSGCLYNYVFDAVPTQMEVSDALIALQNFMKSVTSGAQQQTYGAYDSSVSLPNGYSRLNNALQLLQTDPSLKRLVVSLSSDKAVWDAVMNNVLHLKVQDLPNSVESGKPQISDKPELSIDILSWILEIIKGKVMELIENFQTLMNDLFQSPKIEKAALEDTELEGKVRSSMLLSVVILLIVILARVQRS